jgi:KaiC/GvpD/RAD55 family RecA-like ATPase
MIIKTPLGIPFFDAKYGGVYPNRVALVTGRAGAGKTIVGLHFIAQALKQQERALMLSTRPSQDLVITAESLNLPLAPAIESGALTLLEYNEFVPGRDHEANISLPPDGFIQLKEIIEQQAVQRVVIDSVLPWITLPDSTHLPEHVFSLVRAFERLGVTALFTLPRPVSAPAVRLRKLVEDVVPVSISLNHDQGAPAHQMVVNKYLGLNPDPEGFYFDVMLHKGIALHSVATAKPAAVSSIAAATEAAAHQSASPEQPPSPVSQTYAQHAHLSETVAPAAGRGRASFASLLLNQNQPGARPAAGAGGVPPPMRGGPGRGGA